MEGEESQGKSGKEKRGPERKQRWRIKDKISYKLIIISSSFLVNLNKYIKINIIKTKLNYIYIYKVKSLSIPNLN